MPLHWALWRLTLNPPAELVVSEVEEVMETPEAGPGGRPASAPVRKTRVLAALFAGEHILVGVAAHFGNPSVRVPWSSSLIADGVGTKSLWC